VNLRIGEHAGADEEAHAFAAQESYARGRIDREAAIDEHIWVKLKCRFGKR